MCGIAGFFHQHQTPSVEHLEALSQSLAHRGPDDMGFLGWRPGEASPRCSRVAREVLPASLVFVHRRLAILDLSPSGWQPMTEEAGRYFITYNGEIYNYLELKAELETLGHHFRSSSDTEVLLAAWKHWGVGALSRLTGMFAFALFDLKAQELWLVRDPFGIKPLYYSCAQRGVAFASELSTLQLMAPEVRGLDAQKAFDYLRYNLSDDTEETLVRGVSQLPPGHWVKVDLKKNAVGSPHEYWAPKLSESKVSFQEAAARVRELFLENVRLHLRSDVPIGVALSGGIDSSAIACAIRHIEPDAKLHAFGFVADDHLSEENWMDLVADRTRAELHKICITPSHLASSLDQWIAGQDWPVASTSMFAQYAVFQKAAGLGIKVMLDGQGADEIFGGYTQFRQARLASLLKSGRFQQGIEMIRESGEGLELAHRTVGLMIPGILQKPLRKLARRPVLPAWLRESWFAQNDVHLTELLLPRGQQVLKRDLLRSLEQTSLPMLLRYEDRNSMLNSIESRVPFLTPQLVDYAYSLPENYLMGSRGETKLVLREALRGLVPEEILSRKDKIGFATPEKAWLEALSPWVESVLGSEFALRSPWLNEVVLRAEWEQLKTGKKAFHFQFWRALNLLKWCEAKGIQA